MRVYPEQNTPIIVVYYDLKKKIEKEGTLIDKEKDIWEYRGKKYDMSFMR